MRSWNYPIQRMGPGMHTSGQDFKARNCLEMCRGLFRRVVARLPSECLHDNANERRRTVKAASSVDRSLDSYNAASVKARCSRFSFAGVSYSGRAARRVLSTKRGLISTPHVGFGTSSGKLLRLFSRPDRDHSAVNGPEQSLKEVGLVHRDEAIHQPCNIMDLEVRRLAEVPQSL